MTTTITVDQLNRLGAEFWRGQTASLNAMLEDKKISGFVFTALEVEIWRGAPPGARHSVEGLLEELMNFRGVSRSSDGRLGGRPKGGDPLQRWIEALVARDLGLTVEGLESKVRDAAGGNLISDVEGDCFAYYDAHSHSQEKKLSVLRSRLRRAKQTVCSKNRLS